MMFRLLTLALASLAFSVTADAEEPLKVFIFAGQSNMAGTGSQATLLPSNLHGQKSDVLFWVGRDWKPYSPGLGQDSGFGPEVSCGFELAKVLGEPVGMIKLSVGGTNLAEQWNPDNPKGLYRDLKKMVEAAANSRPIEVAGMFWMQGEADSGSTEMSSAYSRNLDALINQARRDFRNPDMVFISGRVNSMSSPYLATVRRAQEQRRKYYDWINLDALSKVWDDVHYDTKGIVTMGQLFAKKFEGFSRP